MESRLEQAYTEYLPLLLAALGKLGRSGYVVAPADAMDLVHDFFIEAWPGIEERHDPRKGQFTTYLFGAFLRFARPRIVRTIRWRETLRPVIESRNRADETLRTAAPVEAFIDFARVREALGSLGKREREVLLALLAPESSERAVARQFDLSRHALRRQVVEALGRLAVTIDERGVLKDSEWRLARAIWGEGRSLLDAAESLGLTRAQATIRYRRVFEALASGLAGVRPAPAREGGITMAANFCKLWESMLSGRVDADSLAKAREQLAELLDHVDGCERCWTSTEEARDPSTIYEQLGFVEETLPTRDAEALHAMLAARIDDEVAVERAVVEALLPSLPPPLADLDAWGFQPRVVFQAAEAIDLLLHRFVRLERPSLSTFQMHLDGSMRVDEKTVIPARTTQREVARVANVPGQTAARLAEWLFRAGRSQPQLFIGLEAQPAGENGLLLTLRERTGEEDLFELWVPVVAPEEEVDRPGVLKGMV